MATDEQPRKPMSTGKSILIIIASVLAVIILISIKETNRNPITTSQAHEVTEKKKQWTEVYVFKGNGLKKSSTFELNGGSARLKYSYKGESGIGMGMFSVYIIDEGEDLYKTGGFPELMTQEENDEGESSIQKQAGRYYLNVEAMGRWIVTIEEFK